MGKDDFYDELQKQWNKQKARDPKYIIRDLNVRLHARQRKSHNRGTKIWTRDRFLKLKGREGRR